MNFEQFELHSSVMAGVQNQGFNKPTPIQEKAIPVALKNNDIMGLAQTGTGKTAAFVLPILHRLATTPNQRGLRALIIAPTRELAVQIDQVVKELAVKTNINSTTVFGGVSMNAQVNRLRSGVDIVIACPGRLLDHIRQKTINLSKVEMLVLDEADQMFDMGFLPTIKQIIRFLPEGRQSMLFSATMPNEIKSLASAMLKNPVYVDIENKSPVSLIKHAVYPVSTNQKSDFLLALLKNTNFYSAIVFTRTKHRAKRLAETLNKSGYKSTSLQGNLSQNRRQEAMEGFRNGKYNVMVATDIAARGIDISSVSHVINFDIPSTTEAYTHRIGRTGRASRTGEAYTFITSEDKQMVRAIEKVLNAPLPRCNIEGFVLSNNNKSTDALEIRPSQRHGQNQNRARPSSRPPRNRNSNRDNKQNRAKNFSQAPQSKRRESNSQSHHRAH